MVRQLALGAMVAALGSCSNATTGTHNASTTAAATQRSVERENVAMNEQSESATNAGTGTGGTKDADQPQKTGKPSPQIVRPSPWQPPAEIDPVPPPVEGTEPK